MNERTRGLSLNLGFLKGITRQLRLIARLMADGRVNPLIKLLPVGALIYLVVPTDLMPLLPFDDAAVLWLGGTLFLEMCPSAIVQEHLRAIDAEGSSASPEAVPGKPDPEVIDAEFHEADGTR
jgi:uncharacterized membrane protein YkvA (DUF1232 family)